MHAFRFPFLVAILATSAAPLLAAAPTTAPAEPETQKVTDQLDRLIVERLKPAAASEPILLRARLLLDGTTGAPTTRPAEIVLDLAADDIRLLKDAASAQRRLAGQQQAIDLEQVRALDEQARSLAEAQRTWQRAAEQTDGTYMGIGVESPDETLRSQLSLPPGAGLVVNYVDENGPSKSAVQLHDVLQKLDDQLLINGEQLVALVRMHKPGETVSLTLLRRAKPVTVEVELGRRKAPPGDPHSRLPADPSSAGFTPVWLQPWLSTSRGPALADYANVDAAPLAYWAGPSQPITRLQDRPTTFNDGELLVSFTGPRDLVAVNMKDGTVLFHGPVATDQQWNAMPPLVRDKLVSWRRVVQPSSGSPAPTEKAEPQRK
jgi:hypothetical protein